MFNIYSDGVRSFSGTLEHLAEVRPVERSGRIGARAPGARRGSSDAATGAPARVTPGAVAAYREAIRRNEREPIVHAHQLMHEPVHTIRPEASLADAWTRLCDEGVRQLPVVGADGRLVGLLSERELLGRLGLEGDRLELAADPTVAEAMRREVITAEPITDVRRIARVMADHAMTAMPIVTEDQELVGIVSRGDLLRAIAHDPPLHLWT